MTRKTNVKSHLRKIKRGRVRVRKHKRRIKGKKSRGARFVFTKIPEQPMQLRKAPSRQFVFFKPPEEKPVRVIPPAVRYVFVKNIGKNRAAIKFPAREIKGTLTPEEEQRELEEIFKLQKKALYDPTALEKAIKREKRLVELLREERAGKLELPTEPIPIDKKVRVKEETKIPIKFGPEDELLRRERPKTTFIIEKVIGEGPVTKTIEPLLLRLKPGKGIEVEPQRKKVIRKKFRPILPKPSVTPIFRIIRPDPAGSVTLEDIKEVALGRAMIRGAMPRFLTKEELAQLEAQERAEERRKRIADLTKEEREKEIERGTIVNIPPPKFLVVGGAKKEEPDVLEIQATTLAALKKLRIAKPKIIKKLIQELPHLTPPPKPEKEEATKEVPAESVDKEVKEEKKKRKRKKLTLAQRRAKAQKAIDSTFKEDVIRFVITGKKPKKEEEEEE